MTEIRQEPDVIAKRPVLVALGVGLAVTAASVAGAYLIVELMRGRPHEAGARTWQTSREPLPDDPSEVESAHFGHRAAAEQQMLDARRRLESYGWVDRSAGRVHVPLDVAIDLVTSRAERPDESP